MTAGDAERTAIVTGGGSGIGLAISERLAADGIAVAVLDLDGGAADRTAKAITEGGGTAVEVEHGHGDAIGGQPLADGQADAGAAAGDDRDLRHGRRRHWMGSSPVNVVRCMSRADDGS